jgi:hypothetical protein
MMKILNIFALVMFLSANTFASVEMDRFERRAMEAATWIMPQVMYERMSQVAFDTFGGDATNTVYYYAKPMTSEAAMVTGNNNSPYVHTYHNIENGPLVVEMPAATKDNAFFGTFLTSWHQPIVDVGPDGADKGKGGKYLIVPKGYKGNTTGYIVVIQPTNRGYISIRSLTATTSDDDMAQSEKYIKGLKIYPLGSKPKTKHIALDGVQYDGHIKFDETFWKSAHKAINTELIRSDEKAFYGMMKTLGIEKGKAFEPNEKKRQMFVNAIQKLKAEMAHDFTYYAPRIWGEASQWTIPVNKEMMTTNASYVDEHWNDYSGRGTTFTYYFAPPASLAESKSTTYIKGVLDSDGNPLSGDNEYRLHIPSHREVPAERFYSFLTYSMDTGAYLFGSDVIGIASNESSFEINDDGSVDIHWSASCKSDMPNCMPLNKGENWFSLFRLYGPTNDWVKFIPPNIVKL